MSNQILIHPKTHIKTGLLLILSLANSILFAQEPQKVYMGMEYKQVMGEYRLLTVSLRSRVEGKFIPLPGLSVDVFMETQEEDVLLSGIVTEEDGLASLAIDKNYSFAKDVDGYYTLKASFSGNENYTSAQKTLSAKDFKLTAGFTGSTMSRSIILEGQEYNGDSLIIPAEEIGFTVFIKRMFADLKIGSGNLTDGKAEMPFNENIPGDENGNITFKISVEDNNYQLVELTRTIPWGKPLVKKELKTKNTTAVSYVIFMIVSAVVIAVFGLFLHKRIQTKS